MHCSGFCIKIDTQCYVSIWNLPPAFTFYNEKWSIKLVARPRVDNKLPIESMKNRSHSTAEAAHNTQCSTMSNLKEKTLFETKCRAKCRKIYVKLLYITVYDISVRYMAFNRFLYGNKRRYKKNNQRSKLFSAHIFSLHPHTMKNNFCMSLRSDREFSQTNVRERKTEPTRVRERGRKCATMIELLTLNQLRFSHALSLVFGH